MGLGVLRSVAAVIAGSVTIGVTALGADTILRKVAPAVFASGGQDGSPWVLFLILIYSVVFSGLGGFVSALLSGRSPMKHAIALGILQTIGSIAAVYQAGDALPRWYAAAVLIFPLPVISLGGFLRARKKS